VQQVQHDRATNYTVDTRIGASLLEEWQFPWTGVATHFLASRSFRNNLFPLSGLRCPNQGKTNFPGGS
jgi:hypothetical protein